MRKIFISADQLLRDSFALALLVLRSGYRPDIVVGVWRGGTPVGIAVHEALAYAGCAAAHCPIRTSSYTGIGAREKVLVEGLESLVPHLRAGTRMLLVDDVQDSGQSMAQVLDELQLACGLQMPEVKIAVPWFKPVHNTTQRIPDFYLHETSDWLVFPHELCGLDSEDLLQKPGLAELAEQLLDARTARQSASEAPAR